MKKLLTLFVAFLIGLISFSDSYAADEMPLRIAVAANFADTLDRIAKEFRKETGEDIQIISGSTGKLYAQITKNAPFDIFMSADMEHVKMLITSGKALPDTRMDYAVGMLVLWTPGRPAAKEGINSLFALARISIANPELAPYGKAARETMLHAGVWDKLSQKLVYGESIGQALQFIVSGSADGGFVALSQIIGIKLLAGAHSPDTSEYWVVPDNYHSPLLQSAIVLAGTNHKNQAKKFLTFLKGNAAKEIISRSGYRLPEELKQ